MGQIRCAAWVSFPLPVTWLLNFEELVEVLMGGGSTDHYKSEIEILQELVPLAKANYQTGRTNKDGQSLRRGGEQSRFTVDTPVPYRMSDVLAMIDDRMGRLENKKDLHPYRQLRQRIEMISQDGCQRHLQTDPLIGRSAL